MRIGIDCRLWNESGVGRYVRNLIEQLQIQDEKNEYVLFVKDGEIKDQTHSASSGQESKIKNRFKIIQTNIHWHSLKEQIKLPSILNKENLDLMHFPYFSVPIFYNKPFVITIHDLIINHFPTGQASTLSPILYKLKLLGYKFVLSQAAKKAKKIITVSNATKDEIIEHLKVDPNKVVVTYEGADEITNNQYSISNFKLKNKNYFLYVGNAYPHKNLDRLVQALNILISQSLNISLVLVGKEDYFYKRLKEKVQKMGLESSVIFYGEVSDQELVQLYENAIALVMPSLMEGFGLPVLEAMANKCLVLCSDMPSFKEIASDCAIYFNPSSVEDIRDKMRDVQSNDVHHYTENIKKGFERSKIFSWKTMAKQTLNIYNALA